MTLIQLGARKFNKYRENLSIVKDETEQQYIKSYETLVAKIDEASGTCIVLGYWSQTTSKHINYVCQELRLTQHRSVPGTDPETK